MMLPATALVLLALASFASSASIPLDSLPYLHPSHYGIRPKVPQSNREWSSHWCVGSRGRQGTAGDTTCLFQNVCYNAQTSKWLYHRSPAEQQHPVLMDHGKIFSDFPPAADGGILNLQVATWSAEDHKPFTFDPIQSQPIASTVQWSSANAADVTLLLEPFRPEVMGHYVGDMMFAGYQMLSTFGLLTADAHLLYSKSCEALHQQKNPSLVKKCKSNIEQMTAGLTNQPVVALTDLPATGVTCYSQLIAGAGPHGMQQSWGRSPILQEFYHYYLANIGLDSTLVANTKQPKIVIAYRQDGKHGLANSAELQKHLQQQLSSSNVIVELMDLSTIGNWKSELQYIQGISVLITVSGNSGFSGMFLPQNSAVIVIDTYDPAKQQSGNGEERLWTNLAYLHAFNYPVKEKEVTVPADVNTQNPNLFRERGIVTVDLPRMTRIVAAALDRMKNFAITSVD